MISLTSPVKTRAHRWPAWAKLAALCIASVALFAMSHPLVQLACTLAILMLYAAPGRIFLAYGLRRLWPLWPFVAVLLVWHVATGATGTGMMIALRMVNAVALANLVTMTTSLTDMMALVHRLLRPLGKFGLNLRAIELAAAMVIRFTPVLAQKGHDLTLAWRARSYRRTGWRVIMPFVVLAIDDADHVADALRARGGLNVETKR